jgi:hypothetical protein
MSKLLRLPHESADLENRSPGGHTGTCAKPIKVASTGQIAFRSAAAMTWQWHENRRIKLRCSQPFQRSRPHGTIRADPESP